MAGVKLGLSEVAQMLAHVALGDHANQLFVTFHY